MVFQLRFQTSVQLWFLLWVGSGKEQDLQGWPKESKTKTRTRIAPACAFIPIYNFYSALLETGTVGHEQSRRGLASVCRIRL